MKKTNVAILTAHRKLRNWQLSALEEADDVLRVGAVINCTNPTEQPASARSLGLLLLRRLADRCPEAAVMPVAVEDCAVRDVEFEPYGESQKIPGNVLQWLADYDIDIVINFGVDRLVCDEGQNTLILMFTDETTGGNTLGFYEVLHREGRGCIAVQRVSDERRPIEVYAVGYSKIFHHSYRKTVRNIYSLSRFLLRKAILNFRQGIQCELPETPPKSWPPSNFATVVLCWRLLVRKFWRLLYGAFIEKSWNVATTRLSGDFEKQTILPGKSLEDLPVADDYSFYADPFFSADGSRIRLEALKRKTGLGDIVEIDPKGTQQPHVLLSGAHYSYPFSFSVQGQEFLMPEVASHSRPFVVNLSRSGDSKLFLKGLGDMRQLDATALNHDDRVYLFFGEGTSAANVLHLYYAGSIDGLFRKHPCSPIVIDPASARMGGRIVSREEGLIRFGQDNRYGYGARLNAFRIVVLDVNCYEEVFIGSIEVDDARGPHTIDLYQDMAVVDYYTNRFSPLAGYRRVLSKLSAKPEMMNTAYFE